MGVYEGEFLRNHPGMHWQQHVPERYVGPSAYDPSRDLSPNLPVDHKPMGDLEPFPQNHTTNNNHHPCTPSSCSFRPNPPHPDSGNYNNNPFAFPTKPDPTSSPPEVKRERFDLADFQPKLEELTSKSSSNGHGGQDVNCAGCGRRICDRFYLSAVDRKWHSACLQCSHCRVCLDGEASCFTRQGNIYCKKDYYRMFGMKRCSRCQAAISSSELVMRARDLVFHVHCFTCSVCHATLAKGEQFGMRDNAVFCRAHFDLNPDAATGSDCLESPPYPHHYPASFPSPEFHPSPVTMPPAGPSPSENLMTPKVPFFNGSGGAQVAGATPPRQKGRPRKRKPKDLEALTASLDLNETTYLDYSRGGPGTPGMTATGRSKRMRTSFKHHQLRTMKSYFSINHNPDAKDLKQLSQKTSLPKRVLQVWFQNARAKWRRMMTKQEGKSDKGSESGGLSDLETYSNHGGASVGGIGALGPQSPPFMLGGAASPTSLECS